MKRIIVIAFCLLATSCAKVSIQPGPGAKLTTTPTYSKSNSYFFWGLVGEEHMDVTKTCSGKTPKQIQAQTTFVDGLLGAITLGIYAPRTISIWCS